MSDDMRLRIAVQADIRTRNGVVVTIDERLIRFTQPGPRGGTGATIEIQLGDWEAIDAAVNRLRAAIAASREAVEAAVEGAAEGESGD